MYLHSLVPERHQTYSLKLVFTLTEVAFNYWSLTIVTVYFCFWVSLVFQHLIWVNGLLQ